MTDRADENAARWRGQVYAVEHLVRPGTRFTPQVPHLAYCTCAYADVQTCPRCGRAAQPGSIDFQWDDEAGRTARPFFAVWVRLTCGCEFGDQTLAHPSRTLPGERP